MLIINADDFGRTTGVNRAIAAAFRRGLVSSATVMAVSPGFDEACDLVADLGLHLHVGTHLVLSEGAPLTEPIRRSERFCDPDGTFRPRRAGGKVLRLSVEEREAVATELRAQVAACRARGLPVTHLDSHQHVHTELGLWPLVIRLAREHGIPFVRPARATRRNVPLTTRLNRTVFNARLRSAGLAATARVGDVDDYRLLRSDDPARRDFELMTHPELNADGTVVDNHCSQPGTPLAALLAEVDGVAEAVSFAGAHYAT